VQQIPLSATITVFLLFFGVSVLDAFATRNWWRAGLWLLIALLFFIADRAGRRSGVRR
jgi:hypothetical protein